MLRRDRIKIDGGNLALQDSLYEQRKKNTVANVCLERSEMALNAAPCQIMVGPVYVDLQQTKYVETVKYRFLMWFHPSAFYGVAFVVGGARTRDPWLC